MTPPVEALFLDAGGVLLFPSWPRISDALGAQGVAVAPQVLRDAEPHAKRQLDLPATPTPTARESARSASSRTCWRGRKLFGWPRTVGRPLAG